MASWKTSFDDFSIDTSISRAVHCKGEDVSTSIPVEVVAWLFKMFGFFLHTSRLGEFPKSVCHSIAYISTPYDLYRWDFIGLCFCTKSCNDPIPPLIYPASMVLSGYPFHQANYCDALEIAMVEAGSTHSLGYSGGFLLRMDRTIIDSEICGAS